MELSMVLLFQYLISHFSSTYLIGPVMPLPHHLIGLVMFLHHQLIGYVMPPITSLVLLSPSLTSLPLLLHSYQ